MTKTAVKPVTIATDIGTWTIETGGLPRYSAKDMGLAPAQE